MHLTYKVTLLVIYLVEFYKHSIVDLLQSEELKNFTHFRSNLIDTREKVDINKNHNSRSRLIYSCGPGNPRWFLATLTTEKL